MRKGPTFSQTMICCWDTILNKAIKACSCLGSTHKHERAMYSFYCVAIAICTLMICPDSLFTVCTRIASGPAVTLQIYTHLS